VSGGGGWCGGVFVFQAEDGIRDWSVTGVQTCALPISGAAAGVARGGVVPTAPRATPAAAPAEQESVAGEHDVACGPQPAGRTGEIGRASCRGRGEDGGGRG